MRQETHRVYFQTRSSSPADTNYNNNKQQLTTTTRTATIRLTESATGDDVRLMFLSPLGWKMIQRVVVNKFIPFLE